MAARKCRLPATELETGMFVCELDRPWCQTPFPLQGFYIADKEDISAIKRFCEQVYIDVPLSKGNFDHLLSATNVISETTEPAQPNNPLTQPPPQDEIRVAPIRVAPIRITSPVKYSNHLPMRKAVKQAKQLMQDVEEKISSLYNHVKMGANFDLAATKRISTVLVKSVIENPDALIWLARIQHKDEHTYYHAISASIWGLVFGRQLGIEANILEILATGLLLSQTGKTKLPEHVLTNPDHLNARDYRLYQSYVMTSVELLRQDPVISPQVLSVIEYHRERHNGSGFPKGVTGEKIPLLGKIAGLVDRFQELIQPRGDYESLGPAQAIGDLFQSSDVEFQADLVEQFVGAVGVYPTGSIVELNSGDIGMVVHPNEGRKLWPTVMLLGESARKNKCVGKLFDLKEFNEKQHDGARYVQIANTLPQNSHSADCNELMAATSAWRRA